RSVGPLRAPPATASSARSASCASSRSNACWPVAASPEARSGSGFDCIKVSSQRMRGSNSPGWLSATRERTSRPSHASRITGWSSCDVGGRNYVEADGVHFIPQAPVNESIRHVLSPEARVLLLAIGATSDADELRNALTDGAFSWDRLI